jgi:hypothetical protein
MTSGLLIVLSCYAVAMTLIGTGRLVIHNNELVNHGCRNVPRQEALE